MRYVIGIDGGGTKTHLNIATLDGEKLASCVTGSSNLAAEGKTAVARRLVELIKSALEGAGLSGEDCAFLFMGAAGVVSEGGKAALTDILSEVIARDKIRVTDDAVPAFEGALGRGSGILLISGTGSICLAKDDYGNSCIVGGKGHLCGDEGSGFFIGQAVLRSIFSAFDGRGDKTALVHLVYERLNVSSPQELMDAIYANGGMSKEQIASFAPLCTLACEQGDPVADRILQDAAQQLFLHVAAAVGKLSFPENRTCLAYSGSILKKDTCLRLKFQSLVADRYPNIEIIESKNDAVWGAVSLALQNARPEI